MTKPLQWYKSLSLEQKFGLKESSAIICGIKWEDFTLLFSGSERIEILYNKLILEGIITEKQHEKHRAIITHNLDKTLFCVYVGLSIVGQFYNLNDAIQYVYEYNKVNNT